MDEEIESEDDDMELEDPAQQTKGRQDGALANDPFF